jgi:Zn-dependent protease
MFVGLVGPATNIVIALVAAGLIHVVFNMRNSVVDTFNFDTYRWIITVLLSLGHVNVVLAVFNLIPIPPLDGSSVIERFLPQRYMYAYLQFRRYAMILLLLLVLAYGRVFSAIFDPALHFWNSLLP